MKTICNNTNVRHELFIMLVFSLDDVRSFKRIIRARSIDLLLNLCSIDLKKDRKIHSHTQR